MCSRKKVFVKDRLLERKKNVLFHFLVYQMNFLKNTSF